MGLICQTENPHLPLTPANWVESLPATFRNVKVWPWMDGSGAAAAVAIAVVEWRCQSSDHHPAPARPPPAHAQLEPKLRTGTGAKVWMKMKDYNSIKSFIEYAELSVYPLIVMNMCRRVEVSCPRRSPLTAAAAFHSPFPAIPSVDCEWVSPNKSHLLNKFASSELVNSYQIKSSQECFTWHDTARNWNIRSC